MKYVDSLSTARALNLADGVTLELVGSPRSARSFEPLPDEPQAREAQVESRLIDSAADFLENHVIQFKMPSSAVEGMKRSLEEGMYIFSNLTKIQFRQTQTHTHTHVIKLFNRRFNLSTGEKKQLYLP